MYTSFTSPALPCPGWIPPNRTALCESIAVKEKWKQGGGLSPVVGGDDQIPAQEWNICIIEMELRITHSKHSK